MAIIKKTLITLCILALTLGCKKGEEITLNCDQPIVIDDNLYTDAPRDDFNLVGADIIGNCLQLTVRYGGGCGDIEFKLITTKNILESNPVQRNIRLSLKDEDYCKALLIKEISFDLIPIRVSGDNRVALNLEGWNDPLLYQY